MEPVSVIGLICEDIREEKSGEDTIIGIMPDNLKLQAFPGVLPKLAIYIRINFDPNFKPGKIKSKIIREDGSDHPLAEFKKLELDQTIKGVRKSGAPKVTLIMKAIISPYPIKQAGRLLVIVQIGRKKYTCASLRIHT